MRLVPMMETFHPDSQGRADQACAFGKNPYSLGTGVDAKTASYTITPGEFGCAFSNSGAGGAITFTLPTPFAGARVGPIFKITAQNVVVAPAGSNTIDGAAATLTDSTSGDAGKAFIILYGISATAWIAHTKGTWA